MMKQVILISAAILMAYMMIGCADSVTSPAEQISQDNEALRYSVFDHTLSGNQGHNRNFRAHLSGDEEVPAVDTPAQGQAIFQLSKDGTTLSFKLIAANIEDIQVAHIHCGAAGVNGPPVVFLYPEGPVLIEGRFDGVLAEGDRTNADIIPRPNSVVCPGGIANFDELISKIRSGDAYVNVHTSENPGGEIRGQIY